MFQIGLDFTYQYFVNLHTFSHVSLQIIFLDMVDPAKLPNHALPWIPADGFPWIQHIEDRHFKFIKAYEGQYDTVPVNADLHT